MGSAFILRSAVGGQRSNFRGDNPMPFFPSLDDFGPTRETLHHYVQVIGVITRAHAIALPKWWHISLKVRPDGLVTDNMALPGGGICGLRMDFHSHMVVLTANNGRSQIFDMRAGMTGTEMGDGIIKAVAGLGLSADYDRQRFESDEPREYDPEVVGRYFTALVNADQTFKKHLAQVDGDTGPVQLWPHGFDLSGEWFGARVVTADEQGETKEYPSQLNLGFYPGENDDESYFYSNPFPFEANKLLDKPLPIGASWHTEDWQGTLLPYKELINDPNPKTRLLNYAQAVFGIASPILSRD
jgi:hypothetical protein